MNKKFLLFLFITLFTFSAFSAKAAETGSFDATIQVNGEDRTLSCYVPADYDEANSYNLIIGLHGAGDNSGNYRDFLINNASWSTAIPNTIFVFPDGGEDQGSDFYSPAGDEIIIELAINWAKDNYTVNEERILLSGFSLGGRSALKWGLDNPEKITGLTLFTPAMQSPHDVQNDPIYSLNFNYENADKFPIAISHGTNDLGFVKTVRMLADTLVERNVHLFYFNIPNMQHAIPPSDIANAMFKFSYTEIDEAAPFLHSLYAEEISYDDTVHPKVRVRNVGTEELTNITIKYSVDGIEDELDWTGSIGLDEYYDIELPEQFLDDGARTFTAYMSNVNGEDLEENFINSGYFVTNVFANSTPIIFKENFDNENDYLNNLRIKESGNYISWMYDDAAGIEGGGILMLNTLLAYTNWGLTESFITKPVDYLDSFVPVLSFDYVFNYTFYTADYVGEDTEFSDTLAVYMSNDNWETEELIFKKWGADLATYDEPLTNSLSINDFFISPTQENWRNVKIELESDDQLNNVQFRFDYISGSGGVILIDNIVAFNDHEVSVNENDITEFNVYPNPAKNGETVIITFNSETEANYTVELFDILGNKVQNIHNANANQGNNTIPYMINDIRSGVYFLKLKTGNTESISKIIVE